ncbi:hypothetical protein BJX63DRAFT_175758 [Aspergillus granulosus]|uniref:Uncharacterized protein n=1 Tax=Aspergillus granulosus TaxID=176169 RepID=A0ABR4I2M4_9EURO
MSGKVLILLGVIDGWNLYACHYLPIDIEGIFVLFEVHIETFCQVPALAEGTKHRILHLVTITREPDLKFQERKK